MQRVFVLVGLSPAIQSVLIIPAVSECILGRSSRCMLVINHFSVSRWHAKLVVGESHLRVEDLGSRNGTFVDNVRIHEADVTIGQRLQLGGVRFLVSTLDEWIEAQGSSLPTDDARQSKALPRQQGSIDRLSSAQCRVFRLIVEGMTEREAAAKLKLSAHTVHNHVRAIYQVFGVHSRAELLAQVIRTSLHPDS